MNGLNKLVITDTIINLEEEIGRDSKKRLEDTMYIWSPRHTDLSLHYLVVRPKFFGSSSKSTCDSKFVGTISTIICHVISY